MNTLRLQGNKDNHPPLLSYSAPFSTFLNNTLPPIARPSSFQSDIILACGPDTTEAKLRHCDIRTVPRTTQSIIHQFPSVRSQSKRGGGWVDRLRGTWGYCTHIPLANIPRGDTCQRVCDSFVCVHQAVNKTRLL